jgi:hypothetical protein
MSALIEPAISAPVHDRALADIPNSKCLPSTFVYCMCLSIVRLMLEVRDIENLLAAEYTSFWGESVLHYERELLMSL